MANENLTRGIIGLVAILAGFGGSMYLTHDQLNHAYVCSTNQEVGIFDRLSSTMKTGYWMENNIEKSKVCKNGNWIKLKDYAEQNNISISTILNQIPGIESGGNSARSYSCNYERCVPI